MKLLFLLFSLLPFLKSDLPIHCIRSQTVGKWKFYLSEPKSISAASNTCGHQIPDNEKTSSLAMSKSFKPHSTFLLNLMENGCVQYQEQKDNKQKNSKNHHYFSSYFKSVAQDKYRSYQPICRDQAHMGYSRNNEDKTPDSAAWTMVYDEGFEVRVKNLRLFAFQYYFPHFNKTNKYNSNCSRTCVGWYREEGGDVGCFWAEMVNRNLSVNYISEQNDQLLVVENKVEVKKFNFLQNNNKNGKNIRKTLRFKSKDNMGKENFVMSTHSSYHMKVIERINKNTNNLWTATYYPQYHFMSISELNRMAGKTKKHIFSSDSSSFRLKTLVEDVSDLPTSFTWLDYLSPPPQQGSCGSCYALATLSMLEARLNIHHKIRTRLSQYQAVHCNYYNQGCEGGYSVLLSKFAQENYLVEQECSGKGKEQCDFEDCNNKYAVQDYWYIGGRYGNCSERKIMEEIMKNGPVVLSFEPDYTFMLYGKGIYHSPKTDSWLHKGENKPEWYKVDHSVLCYGWGQEGDQKYWLLMNSWGEGWGEKGHFKMKRGVDELGIEFIGEAAMIKPIEEKGKKY